MTKKILPNHTVLIVRQNVRDGAITGIHLPAEIEKILHKAGIHAILPIIIGDMGEEQYIKLGVTPVQSGNTLSMGEIRLLGEVFDVEEARGNELLDLLEYYTRSELTELVNEHNDKLRIKAGGAPTIKKVTAADEVATPGGVTSADVADTTLPVATTTTTTTTTPAKRLALLE